ncbi:hypothetical protein GGS23DRAFT_567794 [Durotheca rogersii]|uniref:uncharacterized protein n=1 Tax=Durotheca rogersii TaxID=419775 RepID=UPI002220720A|nr:uncharacterized protein GGS23DRAFT_567794 [Durotheca rogersii]KAI5863016.1 hypothetical protein GGS23DRAFT_567794 [Durotheca rogersii]
MRHTDSHIGLVLFLATRSGRDPAGRYRRRLNLCILNMYASITVKWQVAELQAASLITNSHSPCLRPVASEARPMSEVLYRNHLLFLHLPIRDPGPSSVPFSNRRWGYKQQQQPSPSPSQGSRRPKQTSWRATSGPSPRARAGRATRTERGLRGNGATADGRTPILQQADVPSPCHRIVELAGSRQADGERGGSSVCWEH